MMHIDMGQVGKPTVVGLVDCFMHVMTCVNRLHYEGTLLRGAITFIPSTPVSRFN